MRTPTSGVRRRAAAAVAVAVLAAVLGTQPCEAGEEPEHYYLVYVLASAAGYSNQEAQILASASWAMDTNADTVAFIPSREKKGYLEHLEKHLGTILTKDTREYVDGQLFGKGGNFAYAVQGKTGHALGSPASRKAMEAYWTSMIAKSPPDSKARLVLTGMYLHFVVDSFVHPHEATLGHGLLGH